MNRSEIAALIAESARLFDKDGNYASSLALAKRAVALAEASQDRELIARANYRVAVGEAATDQTLNNARSGLERALQYADALTNWEDLTNLYNLAALFFRARNEPDLSRQFFEKSIEAAKDDSLRAIDLRCRAYNNLGLLHFDLNEYDHAASAMRKSLEVAATSNIFGRAARAYYNLNLVYEALGLHEDRTRAIEDAYEAVEADRTRHVRYDQALHAMILITGTGAYRTAGRLDKALDWGMRGLQLTQTLGDLSLQAQAAHNLGTVYLDLGDLAAAEILLVQADESFKEQGDALNQVFTNCSFSKLAIKRGEPANAVAFALRALELAPTDQFEKMRILAHQELSKAYEFAGDTSNALIHAWKYADLRHDQYAKLSSLRVREDEVVRLRHQRDLSILEKTQLERQLAFHASSLAAQTELLANFRDELRAIVRETMDPSAAIKQIKEKLKALPCEQIDWLKFEEQFRSVHPDFRQKLLHQYPNLTGQEVRVCQLLRVGMKSFEVARLICISERAVENYRFNIRKKLGLTTEQSLTRFLEAIR
jgi:tetratricopeptide (TPR) repeat protein/DNA-binding CsgD family transcriptional regulator